jgi:hypothetical protein
MKEINAWETSRRKMKALNITYTLNTDVIKVKSKEGTNMGHFYSTLELVNYLYGYESGIMDARFYGNEESE